MSVACDSKSKLKSVLNLVVERQQYSKKTKFASFSWGDLERRLNDMDFVTGKSYKLVCEATREEFPNSKPVGSEPEEAKNKKAGHAVLSWGINDDGCTGVLLVGVTDPRPLREIIISRLKSKLKYSDNAYAAYAFLLDGELLRTQTAKNIGLKALLEYNVDVMVHMSGG